MSTCPLASGIDCLTGLPSQDRTRWKENGSSQHDSIIGSEVHQVIHARLLESEHISERGFQSLENGEAVYKCRDGDSVQSKKLAA